MGTSNSAALGFNEISHACLGISNNRPKPGFIFTFLKRTSPNFLASSTFALQQKFNPEDPSYPGVFMGSLSSSFDEFNISATIQNSNGLDFQSLIINGQLPVTENIGCSLVANLNKNPHYQILTNLNSKIASGEFSLAVSDNFSQIGYEINSGLALNDLIFAGLGLSQESQESPITLKTAGFVDLKILQFSSSFTHQLSTHQSLFSFGTNLVLDPNNIVNVSCIKGGENESAAIGYVCGIRGTSINSTLSTDGALTSKLTRAISENMTMTAGVSVTLTPLSCSPSLEVQVSA
ncbi:hypothetical protein TRFO_26651 [Tritrichomonas foetus]|uniref:Uncharacterized protein n=1 Tax=Tritrichomonas foetus TaxID=1144522 RepID=A0A1J4K3N0_9EUKA|nr:hypothetical protein TRFO_26651 [Tritrichomonas foetus]|eukprot:OHT05578.1 hypothetical protein TRFO_26651 [Tritrichomonas foetus]